MGLFQSKHLGGTEKSSLIPKTLYLTYKTKDIPPQILQHFQTWNPGWNIQFYDDQDCIAFLKKHYPERYVNFFQQVKYGPIKADLWRLCVLHKYGGVYCDVDLILLKGVEQFLEPTANFASCLGYEGSNQIFQAFLAATPGHPILKDCMEMLVRKDPNALYWNLAGTFDMYKIISQHFPQKPKEGLHFLKNHVILQLVQEICPNLQDIKSCFAQYKNEKIFICHSPEYDSIQHTF